MNKCSGGWKNIAFLFPSFLGVSIFVLVPFLDVVRRSFTDVTGEQFTGFDNYKMVFASPAFRLAMGNTWKFLMVCVPALMALSLLLAAIVCGLEKKARRKCLYRNVCLLPMAVPVASLVFVWNVLFHEHGILNSYFGSSVDWLHSSYTFAVLVISFLWKNMGYFVVLWLTGLEGIPESQYEAAALDGASRMARFWYIMLPGLRHMAIAVFILTLTRTFQSYREAYLLAGEYPDKSIYLIQHLLHNWFRDMSMEKMSASAVVIVCVFAVIVYAFCKKGGEKIA